MQNCMFLQVLTVKDSQYLRGLCVGETDAHSSTFQKNVVKRVLSELSWNVPGQHCEQNILIGHSNCFTQNYRRSRCL